jgi:hypothetical protein
MGTVRVKGDAMKIDVHSEVYGILFDFMADGRDVGPCHHATGQAGL